MYARPGNTPQFAEGFNKRATVLRRMGSQEASVRDVERIRALGDPI